MLDIQPYAANHGSKTARYQEVTDHLNEHLETELGIRTVKEHFLLLVKEFKATDCEYRKKSGVAEGYTEHKQLLQNITEEMRNLETKKRKKRKADQDKSDRLESAGAKLREQALKRRCQRGQSRINEESDASNDSSQESSTTAEVETTSTSSTTIGKTAGVTTAQVNMAAVSFIEGQHKRRDDEFELLREELRFKQAKAAREEARWKADMEFRQHEADRKAKKSSEDAELRRTELALRHEELAELKHQLGIQRLPNGAQQTFV
ncbi:Hypothetical protein PHPALM_3695 [Phytophthora palmivora]|uniref:Uncharacterized protein n=1 Tax=Phytophthora palmivora TaxID=4796 RepID=A0A2P4YLR6_9STRA|nr:Hypothetical protein PHPALM_3695 [Phytophthora palmivora]